ncbi:MULTISPECIES: hypothetical protein [unclassified Nocardioides]|uniref:hypothetical protein n=1 Tax=unclassified Nocardioides TaxID=2615069 RepID=UPI0012E32FB0|nr:MULTISPECIES: hypothetical protein [unclassified Nocardioides]
MADDYRPGYPHDLRDPRLMAREATGPYGDFEGRAARVVARATGLITTIQDDNRSARTPDLRIEDADSIVGIGEIVTTTDGLRADQLRAFAAGKLQFDSEELRATWWVTVTPRARREDLETVLVRALRRLEERGDHVHVNRGVVNPPSFPETIALESIGLTELHCDPTPRDGPGRIYGLPEGIGGPAAIDWDGCAAWIDEFLHSDLCLRKLEKLTGAHAPQGHLYVGVTGNDPWPVHQALDDRVIQVPLPPPDLPTGLTHLWLDNAEFPSRVIAWWPDRGWFDVRTRWMTE